MAMLRWRALLKVALWTVGMQVYCAPLRVLEHDYSCYYGQREHCSAHPQQQSQDRFQQYQDVMFLRMWVTFALTLYALSDVVSKQVVLVSCLHASIHFARSISEAPPIVAMPSSPLLDVLYYWRENSIESCVYEYATLVSFALLLRCVLFPPPSALLTFQRHSHHLKEFFNAHDKQFVPLVDRLLEEYTGHERLLYARIRRLYREKTTPAAHLKTP